jgi:hypothetical protein
VTISFHISSNLLLTNHSALLHHVNLSTDASLKEAAMKGRSEGRGCVGFRTVNKRTYEISVQDFVREAHYEIDHLKTQKGCVVVRMDLIEI